MLQTLQRIFVAALLLVALPAVAQDDPPARVGRLAVFENEVFFRADRSIQGPPNGGPFLLPLDRVADEIDAAVQYFGRRHAVERSTFQRQAAEQADAGGGRDDH